MKIISLLPSSTEIVFALGLGDQLVGVTHECDYPEEATTKPVVVKSAFDPRGLSPQQIDEVVSRTLKANQSLYSVDEIKLKELAPDLIITQDLCQVCAPSGNEIGRVLKLLPKPPEVIWLSPNTLSDILRNIEEVGSAVGRITEANEIVQNLKQRIEAVSDKAKSVQKHPRIFCMEWLSPPYNAGHWMPEMVSLAGGSDGLGQRGQDSTRIAWEQILDYAPEVLILCPCGFDLEGAIRQAPLLTRYPEWDKIPAVKEGLVFAVDANSYFARPGPRIIEGLELLSALIHPEVFSWKGRGDAFLRLTRDEIMRMTGTH